MVAPRTAEVSSVTKIALPFPHSFLFWDIHEYFFQKSENDKNRAKVLTQGDKLNIIKASRQQQEKIEKSERKITDFHKQTKVSSRVSKPNILPKRDSVTSSTTRQSIHYFPFQTLHLKYISMSNESFVVNCIIPFLPLGQDKTKPRNVSFLSYGTNFSTKKFDHTSISI